MVQSHWTSIKYLPVNESKQKVKDNTKHNVFLFPDAAMSRFGSKGFILGDNAKVFFISLESVEANKNVFNFKNYYNTGKNGQ